MRSLITAFSCWLHYWQELSGAILGGLLGVIGAMVVARSAANRERRNASRMLQRDLLTVTTAISALTYGRKATLETVGPDTLARNLVRYVPQLSPLFEAQVVVMIGTDARLAALLTGFHQYYSIVQTNMRRITADLPSDDSNDAQLSLPRLLQHVDDYAQAALYLLPLQELGLPRRLYWRLRRRLWPDQQDKDMRGLLDRLTMRSARR
ncbi:MAG TPA: hypothetical protein VET46_12990 [Steroidobacteraceae bacterium]|nr:hypothetical protein [Steroidobacteraceae bacterium]